MYRSLSCPLAILALASSVPACIDRPLGIPYPEHASQSEDLVAAAGKRDVDILFVIDNSGSMEHEQDSLAFHFPRFIQILENTEGGLPNVHIGVVSTNVGAGGACGTNDNGVLQNTPRPRGSCSPPDGQFIIDSRGERNFSGSLGDAFSCIARLGTDGCGYEQPLEAMRRALNGSNPENDGFVRESADLAVIFVTDEDDCSTERASLFGDGEAGHEVAPNENFRCFEAGVRCDPDRPRDTGSKQGCTSREDSYYTYEIGEYIDFLLERKGTKDIVVGAIAGTIDRVSVGLNAKGQADLGYSCTFPPGCTGDDCEVAAQPAIRLTEFTRSFGEDGVVTSLCGDNLSAPLEEIALRMARKWSSPCLSGMPYDLDEVEPGIQPECVVAEIQGRGTLSATERIVPQCDRDDVAAATDPPCWTVAPDQEVCADTPSALAVRILPAEYEPADGTDTVAWCRQL